MRSRRTNVKTAFIAVIALLLVLFQPASSHANGIYQMEYRYVFDGTARDSAHGQTFVVCEDACTTAPYLAPAPRFPALSVRISQDVAAGKEDTRTGQEGGKGETAVKTITNGTQRGRDARITVLFGLDSWALSNTERARLSSFVESTGAETKGGDLSVTGYTCDLGSKAHNDILAGKRAEAVATYLRKAGLRPSRVTGIGRCCYVTEDQANRYLNRRVEATISKREAAQ